MELVNLIATLAALAGLLLTLVQLLKAHLGLKGKKVLVVSALLGAALGAVFAAGGLIGFNYLPAWPPPVGGALLGLLSGLVASGGKDTITGIQINGAKARAKAEAEYGCPTGSSLEGADEWVEAALDDLLPEAPR